MNLGKLIAVLGVDTTRLVKAREDMRRFETKMNASVKSVNDKLKSVGSTMKSFGRDMSKYVTLPISLIGGAAFKMYKDFEASMSKVIGLVGISKTQVASWSKQILQLAPTLGKAPKELADAMFFITSAGLQGANALQALIYSAKASVAGLGETKVIADLVTSAMNAYGAANLSAKRATDVLTAAVREGKAEAQDLAASMGQVLPIASAMQVSFDQVGAAIAAMTRTGTNAQTAAIQLRQILNSILKSTQQAEQALYDMGTSTEELRKTIKERGLLATLMKVRELTQKYGETVASKVFPNIRALSGVLDLMGSNLADNIAIFKSMQNATGSLDKAFNQATSTVQYKWNKAIATGKTALTILGKTISGAAIPLIESLSDKIQKVTDWFNSLNDSTKTTIVRFGAIAAAIGSVTIAMGYLATNVIPGLINIGRVAVTVFGRLSTVLLTTPLGWVLAGVAALTAGLYALNKAQHKVSVEQSLLNRVNTEGAKAVAQQKVELYRLLNVANSDNASKIQKANAIERINQISPAYLGNITQETIRTGRAKTQIDAYIQSLERKAKIQAANDALVEVERKHIEALMTGESHQVGFWQTVWNLVKAGGINASFAISQAETSMKNAKEEQDKYAKSTKFLNDYINQQSVAGNDLAVQYNYLNSEIKQANTEVKGLQTTLKTAQDEQTRNAAGQQIEALINGTREKITGQLNLEKEYTKQLDSQLEQRYKNDEKLQQLMLGLKMVQANKETKFSVAQHEKEIADRKAFLGQEIQLQKEANSKRIAQLTDYLNQYNALSKQLNKKPETTTGGPIANPEEVAKVLAKVAAQEKYITLMTSSMGKEFDTSSAKVTLYQNAIQNLLELGVDPANASIVQFTDALKKANEEISKSKSLNAQLGAGLDKINALSQAFGSSYDAVNAKIQLYNQIIEQAAGNEKVSAEQLQKWVNTLKELKDQANSATSIFQETDKALAQIPARAKIFGDSFNKVNAEINIYRNALEKLQSTNTALLTDDDLTKISEYIAKLKELGYNFDSTGNKAIKGLNGVTSVVNQVNGAITGNYTSWTDWFNLILGTIPNIVESIITLIGKIFATATAQTASTAATAADIGVKTAAGAAAKVQAEGENVATASLFGKATAAGVAATTEGIATGTAIAHTTALTAQAAVVNALAGSYSAAAVAAATLSAATVPFPATIGAIAANTGAVLGALATIPAAVAISQAATKIPKLAEGGTVPPGYPNDSYPAFLTSGETITPPGQLPPSYQGSGGVHVEVSVKGVTRGQDIYYVVEEVKRTLNNSF